VRTNAIYVLQSDAVIISDNRLTFASERGRGIVLDFDSDDNQITGNTITGTDAASTGLVRQMPGGPLVTAANSPHSDTAIHVLQTFRQLQNFVVSGVLFQLPTIDPSASDFEDSGRPDHNVIAGNDIIDLGRGPSCTLNPNESCRFDADCVGTGPCLIKQNSGVAFNNRAADSIVRGNRFSGRRERGITFGGTERTNITGTLPGTCSLDPNRICSSNNDCNIPGYDTVNRGSCLGAKSVAFNGNSMRLTAEDNTFLGDYDTAALYANFTDYFTFRRNIVAGGSSGIWIGEKAINGLIERNVVSGASAALSLAFSPNYTQSIRLNDFINYSVAVRTTNNFLIPTDIAADTGNYWGLGCPGFGPGLVFFDSGAANSYVTDGKAYGEPVAGVADASLPARCE
jgi:hypothetical protein